MEDSLITYKTAKLAKERGFPQKGNLAYNKDGNLGKRYKALNYAAPTQSLLQKWLREKHNIVVCVTYFPTRNSDEVVYQWECNQGYHHGVNEFTYEEALEEGLQSGLNLIY